MRRLHRPEDHEWFERLFDLHSTTVRAYAIRRVGADSADDIVSEVFATAWRRLPDVPDPALPWLLRVAHNTIQHERRSLARQLRVRDAVEDAKPGHHPPPEQSSRVLAESILSQLPVVDAEILRLTAWERLSPAEIAVVLDLGSSAARNRLMRARRRAQQLIRDDETAVRLTVVPATR